MTRDDGGPAFPSQPQAVMTGVDTYAFVGPTGMSLRDYFAAKAMHAELNTSGWHAGSAAALTLAADNAGRTVEAQIAFNAYAIADAMLKERAK